MPGLEQKQMLQTAVSSRDEWLTLQKLPALRAFMFFNMLPKPESDTFFSAEDFGTKKLRDGSIKNVLLHLGRQGRACPHAVRISRKRARKRRFISP